MQLEQHNFYPNGGFASRKLFAVSIKAKRSANHTDSLSKYLARFGLKYKNL